MEPRRHINRYLKGEKLTSRLLFEQVEPLLEPDPKAYLIFDDTVLDKSFGPSIEVTRKQWRANEKSLLRGIGMVSCVYVNSETERFWVRTKGDSNQTKVTNGILATTS